MSIASTPIFLEKIFGILPMGKETAYGFHTKLKIFIERIERLRHQLGKEKREMRILDVGCGFSDGLDSSSIVGFLAKCGYISDLAKWYSVFT